MLLLNLLLLVALCHSQDLDAIMAEIKEIAPTPGYSQTTDNVVTYVTETTEEGRKESSRRKREDVTPENATDGGDIGGDLDAIVALISEAATQAATEAATEPIENPDSWVTPDSRRK